MAWSVAVVGTAAALAAGGWVAAKRVNVGLTRPAVVTALPTTIVVPGTPPALTWPGHGQAAVTVPALGYAAQSGPEAPVPVASLTKMTSALVVLRDHPLAAGSDGPSVTVTPDDVAEYDAELHADQSTVPIRLGETLTERQMLEALLTQSANDIAYALAIWDAGGIDAFVGKMNALAASLGAAATHYVDASGYDPRSVSTAADSLRIAAAGMADPTFAAVVGMTTVTLPLVGTAHNIVTEVGSNGVVGIKSGYTSAAGGCMLLAADRVVNGRTVLVLAAVLGQPVPPPTEPSSTTTTAPTTGAAATPAPPASVPASPSPSSTTTTTTPASDLEVPDPFHYTRPAAEGLLSSAEAGVTRVVVAEPGQPAGTVTATWGGRSHQAAVVASGAVWLLGWPGQRATSTTTLEPVAAGASVGEQVGTASFRLGGQTEAVPLRLATTVPEPSWWWRLVHD